MLPLGGTVVGDRQVDGVSFWPNLIGSTVQWDDVGYRNSILNKELRKALSGTFFATPPLRLARLGPELSRGAAPIAY